MEMPYNCIMCRHPKFAVFEDHGFRDEDQRIDRPVPMGWGKLWVPDETQAPTRMYFCLLEALSVRALQFVTLIHRYLLSM